MAVKRIALIAFVAIDQPWLHGARAKVADPRSPLPAGRSVFFVPVGDFPRVEAEALAAHYNEKFGMAIGILPSLTLPRNGV